MPSPLLALVKKIFNVINYRVMLHNMILEYSNYLCISQRPHRGILFSSSISNKLP